MPRVAKKVLRSTRCVCAEYRFPPLHNRTRVVIIGTVSRRSKVNRYSGRIVVARGPGVEGASRLDKVLR